MPWNGYPTTVYRAMKLPNGKVVCADIRVIAQTSLVIRSSDEYDKATSLGWCDHPDLAVEQFEQREQEIGNAAGERAFSDAKMSEKAQKEAADYEKTVPLQHVPVIPEAKP